MQRKSPPPPPPHPTSRSHHLQQQPLRCYRAWRCCCIRLVERGKGLGRQYPPILPSSFPTILPSLFTAAGATEGSDIATAFMSVLHVQSECCFGMLPVCSEALSAVVFRVALCSCVQSHSLQLRSESLSAVAFRVALCSCVRSLSAVVFLCGGLAVCTEFSCIFECVTFFSVMVHVPDLIVCLLVS